MGGESTKIKYGLYGISAALIFLGVYLLVSGVYLIMGKADEVNLAIVGAATSVGGFLLAVVGMLSFTLTVKFLR